MNTHLRMILPISGLAKDE